MGMDQGANTMEINDANIKTFNRVAAKYNIDYAVQKDKSVNPPKYIIYFKGRDADVIAKAFYNPFPSLNISHPAAPNTHDIGDKAQLRL